LRHGRGKTTLNDEIEIKEKEKKRDRKNVNMWAMVFVDKTLCSAVSYYQRLGEMYGLYLRRRGRWK
jgi:hypothetical protein